MSCKRAATMDVCRAALLLVCAAVPAAAQPAASSRPPSLGEQLDALARARLLSLEAASAEQLRTLVAQAEQAVLDGRHDHAVVLLLEALESPRYADFHDFPEYAAAEHMAGQALFRVGALAGARRYLERAVTRGPRSPYYGPAVRRLVDVALSLGDLKAGAHWLAQHEQAMTDDARSELAYLRARVHYDRGERERAAQYLGSIGKRSRFYGNAQYLLGAIAAHDRRWKTAEQRFCAVAATGVEDRYSFYVDERFFEVQDLARLALGRTAHETRRGDDAFYYYFQVPRDSPRLPEALFEAAYASYEAEEHDTALDLLDQLQAHYPTSAFADEAGILRGYVALGRCDFDRADREFTRFIERFTPLVARIDRLLENRARRDALYETLLSRSANADLLVQLLPVHPEFYRLHEQVRALDAEAARAGRVADALDALRVRFAGGERPRASADEETAAARQTLERDLGLAALQLRALGDHLDALRAQRVSGKQLAARERELGAIAERLHALEQRASLSRARAAGPTGGSARTSNALSALLAADVQATRALPARVAAVRAKLVAAASASAHTALRELRARLWGLLRRARIGRIDAVMGSKRRIELQIESLAAGRFPDELRDPLRAQGLLADDEEYWPFEGEDWPDEFEERYRDAPQAGGGARKRPSGARR